MLSSQKILVAFRPRKFKPIRCCYAASNDSRARRAFRSGSVIWTTGDMDAETETPEPSHPWPYLKEMFMFTGSRNESFKFQCLNYLPQRKELLAFKNSPSNLKKHIERRHRSHLQRYMDLTATTTKRKGSLSVGEGPSTSKQQKLVVADTKASQKTTDVAVMNFVVQGLHPFGVVEQPGFISLMQHIHPNYTVMSRTTLRDRIEKKQCK